MCAYRATVGQWRSIIIQLGAAVCTENNTAKTVMFDHLQIVRTLMTEHLNNYTTLTDDMSRDNTGSL